MIKPIFYSGVLLSCLLCGGCYDGLLTQRHAFAIGSGAETGARIKLDTAYSYSKSERNEGSNTQNGGYRKKYYLDAYNVPDETERKRVRNEIIYEIMAIIDEEHGYSMDRMRRYRGHAKMSTKLINIGTHIATATSPGAQTISVLSAIGAGATSMDDSIDASYLQDSSLRAIFSAMEAEKISIKSQIAVKLSRDKTSEYPLQAGFVDLKNYWEVGFIHKGVALLEQKSAAQVERLKAGESAGVIKTGGNDSSSATESGAAEALRTSVPVQTEGPASN